jgi:hypothetical protein
MEVPNLLFGSFILAHAWMNNKGTYLGWFTVILFMFHYVIRTIVYSYLMKGGRAMPLDILCLGTFFTFVNGFVQSYHHLFELEEDFNETNIFRIAGGFAIFLTGFIMNQWSDDVLRKLRKDETDHNYYIPQSFLFSYLSAPKLVGGKKKRKQ